MHKWDRPLAVILAAERSRRRYRLRPWARFILWFILIALLLWLIGEVIEWAGWSLAMKATHTSPADIRELGLR